MKIRIGTFLAAVALACTSNATIILNESFAYADGILTNVSANAWNAFSGHGVNSIQVISGMASITQSGTEDCARALAGSPYTNLYASFVVNFSAPPSGIGGYFWMFKDNGSTTFRARAFAATTNAPNGKYRVGIANGGTTPVMIAADLDYGVNYKLVVRLVNGTNATMWINPTSESSVVNKADATDSTSPAGITTVALRQAIGMGTLTLDDLFIGTQFADVQTLGGPPSISGLGSKNIPANSNTGQLPFLVSDVETAADSLTLAAFSDNTRLVPNNPANLAFGGSGGNRTLTVTPALGQQGTANIQAVVTDGESLRATNTFTLTVGSPSISAIANQIVSSGTPKTVGFWVTDTESSAGSLTVTATSSDQYVLPDSNIGIVNPGTTNRTLVLTPASAGLAVVSVTVSDGTVTVPSTFKLTAFPDNGILLNEDFSYADGSIITNSQANAYPWCHDSGATGQTQIASGKLQLVNTNSEDLVRWFTNAPLTAPGQLIYTRMVVNLSALPTAAGNAEYFEHIYAYGGQYRARLFVTTNGATAGKFRFAIANSAANPNCFPQDLSLNENHVVITRYNTATAESTLWVDPVSESSANVAALDSATATTVYGISLRQSTGIGSLSIDDLLVGSVFSEVLLALPGSNANLADMVLSAGTLTPTFASGNITYAASVPSATTAITLTPTAEDAGATIQIRVNDGVYATVPSGAPSGPLALNVGANTVDVQVTSPDAATAKTYTTTVTRVTPDRIPISRVLSGNKLILSWNDPAFSLYYGTKVMGITNRIIGATSPYTNAIAGPEIYFRLAWP